MTFPSEHLLEGDIREIRSVVGVEIETDAAADELWTRYRISYDEACILAHMTIDQLDLQDFAPVNRSHPRRRRKAS